MKKGDKVRILRSGETGVIEGTATFGPAKVVTISINGRAKTFTENEVELIEIEDKPSVAIDALPSAKNKTLSVAIINKSPYPNPEYKHDGDAGMDLKANIEEPVVLGSLDSFLFPTGLFVKLPKGYEAQIRPRSGLACKHGITVSNSPGTVDSTYVGEIKVSLTNISKEPFTVNPGDRIAQMVVARHETVEWTNVETLEYTERGDGGFGSTGTN